MPTVKPIKDLPKAAVRTGTRKSKGSTLVRTRRPGRPSVFSEKVADRICDEIATSTRSIRAICAQEGMPDPATVYRWRNTRPEFCEHYARAKEAQAELLVEELIEIADDSSQDTIETEQGAFPNKEWILRAKLRVDTRKWLAMKLLPKKYGDKLEVEHGGKVALTLAEMQERIRDAEA